MKDGDNNSDEIGSNYSVLNLSLNVSDNDPENSDIYSDSFSNSSFDIPKCLSKKIDLKEEKEENNSNISNFECFEIINKEKKDIIKKRRKTDYIPQCLINNAPKIKLKECDEEIISPLILSLKTFSQDLCPKNSYNILYDFQKDLIDCKSCDNNLSEVDYFSDDTERTTPNVNDLNNFSICRKKMKNIINNSNIKSSYEYENILNSDLIFQNKSKFSNSNLNSKKNKKYDFWHKHIIKEKLKLKQKNINKKNIVYSKSKTYNFDEKKIMDTQGLFILGILESAAKEKKKRITTGNVVE